MTSSELILPQPSRLVIETVPNRCRHPGLQLDKLSPVGDMRAQKGALSIVCEAEGDKDLLSALCTRRKDVFQSIGASALSLATRTSLTLHLARGGSQENAGIALHPIYGFPILPGSGLKGMTRSWAETVWAPNQRGGEDAWRKIEEVFGWGDRSESHKGRWRPSDVGQPPGSSTGGVVFHDGWPREWPRMGVDIANNHNAEYYSGNEDAGDWHDPVPVYFLVVPVGQVFDFALSSRGEAHEELVEHAKLWLSQALEWDGTGAKTAAGYGRFSLAPVQTEAGAQITEPRPEPLSTTSKPHEGRVDAPGHGLTVLQRNLTLSAPGFLAGANQRESDCDLRSASLRGLLRWWWRTMHAGAVDRDILRRLEAAVWGDVRFGSPVRIALQPKSSRAAEKSKGGGSAGLRYISYGMGDRWYRHPSETWELTATVRQGRFRIDDCDKEIQTIAPHILLEQLSCALWLLTHFGGAGSRSRKGFGSFRDLLVDGVTCVEDCLRSGARFRESCGIIDNASGKTNTPSLEGAILRTWNTDWNDPWHALDRIGTVYQDYAKSRISSEDRAALGLPRRVGGGKQLKVGEIDRHASPAFWSLSSEENKGIVVRLIAFPAPLLPNQGRSEAILRGLAEFADEEIPRMTNEPGGRARGLRSSAPHSPPATGPSAGSRPSAGPQKGTWITATLSVERTRKGGWKALHEETGKEYPIKNTEDVPEEMQPGKQVELYVFSSDAFEWPTPEVKARVERAQQNPGRQKSSFGRRR